MEIEVHSELSESARSKWQRFLIQSEHQHPRQNSRYAIVERAAGNTVWYVIGRKNNAIKAIGIFCLKPHPFLRGFFSEATCFSGPVCNSSSDFVSFLEKLRALPTFAKVGRIKVTPYWTDEAAMRLSNALQASGWTISDEQPFRETGWVDLSLRPDAILANFSKSARREVRRAERQGVEIRMITEESRASEFLSSLNRLQRTRGLPVLNGRNFMVAFENIYRSQDLGALVGAYQNDEFVAGVMLLRSKHTAHTPHFTTEPDRLRALSNLRVAPFVWLKGMLWAKQKGCLQLDVEGWQSSPDPRDKKYNIYKYKGEFSPTPILRAPEHMLPLNRFTHAIEQGQKRMVQLAKVLRPLSKK